MTIPITSKAALNAGYVTTKDDGSYIGMANSAILCTHPIDFNDYYVQDM